MGAHFPAVELDNAIWFSTFSRMPRFLWHSSKWAHRLDHFLQYIPMLGVLACNLDTKLNYVTAMLQLCLSLNHKVKLWQLLRGRCGNFRGVFSWIDAIVCIGVSTPPLLLYLAKPPLNWQTVQAPFFRQSTPLYCLFMNPP